MDVALSQFNSWMFLHHTSRTAIFTWNLMVVDTRHKWDVLISYSWMDVIPTHNGRFYWRHLLIIKIILPVLWWIELFVNKWWLLAKLAWCAAWAAAAALIPRIASMLWPLLFEHFEEAVAEAAAIFSDLADCLLRLKLSPLLSATVFLLLTINDIFCLMRLLCSNPHCECTMTAEKLFWRKRLVQWNGSAGDGEEAESRGGTCGFSGQCPGFTPIDPNGLLMKDPQRH